MDLSMRHAGWMVPSKPVAPCRCVVARARPPPRRIPSSTPAEGDAPDKALKEIKLPKSGYFSLADTEAEVYSKATEPFDPTKKGGRYKSEFIWNTNWQETLKRDEQLEKKRQDYVEAQNAGTLPAEESAGKMNLSLLADLNDMNVDLSAALRKKAAPPPAPAKPQPQKKPNPIPLEPLSRLNAQKLARMNRGSKQPPMMTVTSSKSEDEIEKERLIAEERAKYEKQKVEFQIWTLGFTAMGAAATYTSYSADTSASYIVGALGGYMYLRLLGKSVDAVGQQTVEGSVGGIASQPRLLIPIILALGYNRWNTMFSAQYGITLQLLPMLVGFFTYKVAVLAREAKELLSDMSAKPQATEGDKR